MSDAKGPEDENIAKPDGDAPTGTSLAPAVDAPAGIDPFLASASETVPEVPGPRPFYAKALDYSAHAAMIVGLIGFAWTVSDHVVSRQATTPAGKPAKMADATAPSTTTPSTTTPSTAPALLADAPKVDEIGDLRRANQKMASEIRNLHASLEALRTTVVRDRSAPEDVRSLTSSLDSMKASLASAKSEQAATIAQLTTKIEKLQQRAERPQPVAERTPRVDRQSIDTTTTASIPAPAPKAVPTPPAKPTVLASAEAGESKSDQGRHDQGDKAAQDKPPVISGWVVRDVYQGVALVEGRRGQMEVVPGVSIPGAGTVKSIERHGGGWIVTTSKGQLAYAAPQREYRHGPGRDYYGPRRYDF